MDTAISNIQRRPAPFLMLHFERPLSLGAEKRRGYVERLREKANTHRLPTLLFGRLYARIIWLRRIASKEGDLDNIAKPILDSLKGIVYDDDQKVGQVLLTRIDLDATLYEIQTAALPETVFEQLQDWIDDRTGNEKHCLLVEIGNSGRATITSGPIEEQSV